MRGRAAGRAPVRPPRAGIASLATVRRALIPGSPPARPKTPLGRTSSTATITISAIVSFSSRPIYGMNVPARFSMMPTAKPPSTAPPGLVSPPSTAPAKP